MKKPLVKNYMCVCLLAALALSAGCDTDSYDDDREQFASVDTDGDGVADAIDAFPSDPSETTDNDGDGVGNNADNCISTANSDQADDDADGYGNACDFVPVAENLNSPRGISCASEGGVYVALSGNGAGDAPSGPSGLPSASSYLGADGRSYLYGLTGSVLHIDAIGTQTTVLDGLPSLAHLANAEPRVWVDAAGAVDVFEQADGSLLTAIGLASDACLTRQGLGVDSAAVMGTVITESGTIVADLAAYECNNNTDQRLGPNGATDYTSNLWRIIQPGPAEPLLVVDSGANAVLQIDDLATGALSVYESGFPNQFQTVPDLGLADIIGVDQTLIGLPPAGAVIPAQPVPTGIAVDPRSGKVFVSELTGIPVAIGSARVYEVPGAVPTYDGYTALTDIAFSPRGDLLALEYTADGLLGVLGLSGASGRLSVLTVDGQQVDFSDRLVLKEPTGVAVCDDSVYVGNEGSVAGHGELLRASFSALLTN